MGAGGRGLQQIYLRLGEPRVAQGGLRAGAQRGGVQGLVAPPQEVLERVSV